MQQPKLFTLLQTLTSKELTQLGKFLNSPYFNNSALIKSLFEEIKRWHPKYDSRSLVKEKLFQKIYRDQKEYKYKKITDLMSDLALLIEKFMVVEEIGRNKSANFKLKREIFEKRRLENLYQVQIHKELEYYVNKNSKTAFDHAALVEIYYQYYFHATTNRVDDSNMSIQSVADSVDQFFVFLKLKLEIEFRAREEIIPGSCKNWQIEEVQKWAEEWIGEDLLVEVFLKTIGFLNGNLPEKDFLEINKSLQNDQIKIPVPELGFIMIAMINRAWQLYSKGNEKYIYYLFEIYKTGLQYKNVLLTNDQMRPSTFSNIVVTGCIVKDFNWVRKFMEDYHKKLLPENNGITMDYCRSVVFFHEKNFNAANELLKVRKSSKGFTELRFRFVEVQILFELFFSDHSYESTLNSFINSFVKYIKNTKFLTLEKKELYLQAMRLLKLIKKYVFKKMTRKKRNEIIEQIENTDLIARRWLLEKIDEF